MNWIKLDILTIITITGIAQGIFLSSALLKTKRGEGLIKRMIVCMLSIFSLDILFSIIVQSHALYIPSFFVRIDQGIKLLYGPILFFYLRILYSHKLELKKKDIIHFMPFLISMTILLPISLLSPDVVLGSLALFMKINLNGLIDMLKVLFATAVFIQMSAYIVYYFRKINKERNNTGIYNKNDFSIHRILIFICCAYNILCLMVSILSIFMTEIRFLSCLSPLFATCVLYFIGYIIILKPGLLFTKWISVTPQHQSVYKKIHLSESKSKEYLDRLFTLMEQEKLYKDQDLTLSLLAEKLNLSRNLLSYLLNNVIGTNFYDFINGFRVKAVKDLLANDALEHENILNIAFHAGFNSKSAFNKIFKKYTNMSPSQYRKVFSAKTEEKIFPHVMELNLIDRLENSYGIKSVVRTS